MHILFITATALEMQAALKALVNSKGTVLEQVSIPEYSVLEQAHQPFTLPSFSFGNATIFLAVCGVGPVAAGLSLGRILGARASNAPALQGVLNLGIAGTYATDKAPVGSIVCATEEHFPEYGVFSSDGLAAQDFGFPQATIACEKITQSLPIEGKQALVNMGLGCHSTFIHGSAVTLSGVSGTQERANHVATQTGGLMESMEGFPLALGCRAAGIDFAEIRAISNAAGFRPPHTWNIPLALASLVDAVKNIMQPAANL